MLKIYRFWDSVAYSIFVPGDVNKVWNSGSGSYSGTGQVQNIPMNAQIVPGSSSSNYPAPDMYNDILTATINY